MEEQKENKDFVFLHSHVADLDSSYHHFGAATAWRLSPWEQQCILERRAPIRNSAHPNWHLAGHERLACSWVPAALLRAVSPQESLHHSLSAIPEQQSSKPPAHMCTHSHLLPLYAFCSSSTSTFYISHSIFHYIYIPRIDVTASLLKLRVTRTSV